MLLGLTITRLIRSPLSARILIYFYRVSKIVLLIYYYFVVIEGLALFIYQNGLSYFALISCYFAVASCIDGALNELAYDVGLAGFEDACGVQNVICSRIFI